MASRLRALWLWILQLADLLVLVRVPLLMVLAGFVLAAYVGQIRELFDISLERPEWAFAGWLFAAGFSLLAWYSARTLYSFCWPKWQAGRDLQQWLGAQLPRLLSTAAPLTLALAYWQATPPPGQNRPLFWVAAYLVLAASLWTFTTFRRSLLRHLAKGAAEPLGVSASVPVARYERWNELPAFTRAVHAAGLVALPLSWAIGLFFPGSIDPLGPIALILGAASFSLWASTRLIYVAARLRFPLLGGLALWAVLMTTLGMNDNHAVRFSVDQQSDQDPAIGLSYSPAGRPSLAEFAQRWSIERADHCGDDVWLVSSEGGGIRAAMWTVLVLSELHRRSGGRLWNCTFAVSGVSGGSLGLAVFAGAYRDLGDQLDEAALERLQSLLQADFLAPVLGSMFGVDAVQRFLPLRVFSDRGEALENAWLKAYARYVPAPASNAAADSLAGPLADTLFERPPRGRPLPALLLNTTVVETGLRLVQHPFSTLGRGDLADRFPGVIDGARWLPRELPTFSAVHNSARFTLVSPAGTVLRREGEDAKGAPMRLGQLVDGGYFENSGTTTLQGVIDRLLGTESGVAGTSPEKVAALARPARIRVIHISNDESIEPFARNHLDTCTPPAQLDAAASPADAPLFGEVRAPLIALLATRDARGEYARQALMDQVGAIRGELWHYRLCPSQRSLPLGWTLSPESTAEMRQQLASNANTASILEQLGRSGHQETR